MPGSPTRGDRRAIGHVAGGTSTILFVAGHHAAHASPARDAERFGTLNHCKPCRIDLVCSSGPGSDSAQSAGAAPQFNPQTQCSFRADGSGAADFSRFAPTGGGARCLEPVSTATVICGSSLLVRQFPLVLGSPCVIGTSHFRGTDIPPSSCIAAIFGPRGPCQPS